MRDLGERFSGVSLDDVSYAAKVNCRNDNSSRPKPKSAIKYHLANGAGNEAKSLSYQPKRTGTSKNWVNVVDIGSEHPRSTNWDEVIWWEQIELEALILTEQQEHEQAVIDAKEKELKNLTENKVFTWVEDEGQNAISCKWVLTKKQKLDGEKFLKARLVAPGFEEKNNLQQTNSPTCSRQSLRMIFITAASMKWKFFH